MLQRTIILACVCALGIAGLSAQSRGTTPAPSGSPGPQAASCGNPANPPAAPPTGRGAEPTFPPGKYPVQLPAKSLLGAPTDLPNPFMAGVHWGQLPEGRKEGWAAIRVPG